MGANQTHEYKKLSGDIPLTAPPPPAPPQRLFIIVHTVCKDGDKYTINGKYTTDKPTCAKFIDITLDASNNIVKLIELDKYDMTVKLAEVNYNERGGSNIYMTANRYLNIQCVAIDVPERLVVGNRYSIVCHPTKLGCDGRLHADFVSVTLVPPIKESAV